MTKSFHIIVGLCVCVAWYMSSSAIVRAEDVDTYQHGVGVPTGNSSAQTPLKIRYTVMVNGNPVTKTVEVPNITKWTYSGRGPNETIQQWHDRLASERAAATCDKAQKIVDAVNAAFANEFQQLGQTASVSSYSRKDRDYPNSPEQDWGLVNWPSGQPTRNAVPGSRWLQPDPTKEPLGGGLRRIPGGGGTSSPGMRGDMGRGSGMGASTSTGLDDNGQPSYVDAGFVDGYFATVYPTSGMTDSQVLSTLASDLVAHGIAATFNSSTVNLSLDNPVPDGVAFGFGNTDAGLDFEMNYASAPAVPEPATVGLIGSALLVASSLRRRDH